VYEADGETTGGTTHFHLFTELAQRAIKMLAQPGPLGRLYAVDMRLRPAGRSGSLVVPLAELSRYVGRGCQLWERQALTRARVVRGDPAFADQVMTAVRAAVLGNLWCPAVVDQVRAMRDKLEAAATPRNLKRGPGGLTDIEFLVQLLQLKYAPTDPGLMTPNVWDALDALESAGRLSADDAAALRDGYSFLRAVEARLRVVTDRPLVELPDAPADRLKLARRLGFPTADAFAAEYARVTADIRRRFRAVCERERAA
jgi:glutamate-ammonia-ligase adenylyltransferase